MASVALPAVRRPLLGTTPDHESLCAFLAAPAAQDVVDDDPVTWLETAHSRSHGLDLSGWFVTCDNVPVTLRPRARVLVVDGAQVAPAEPRGLHLYEYLSVARLRAVELSQLHPFSSG